MDLASVAQSNAGSFARLIGSSAGGRVVEENYWRPTPVAAGGETGTDL